MASSSTNEALETIELGNTTAAETVPKPAAAEPEARPARRRLLLAASAVALGLVAGTTALVYIFAIKFNDSSRDARTSSDETYLQRAMSGNQSAMTDAAIDDLMHLLEESGEYEPPTNTTSRRSLLVQCSWERWFGDCYNRERARAVLPARGVSNGWNAQAGSRPGGVPASNFFANNAWTPYEFGRNGRQNGYITHFIDNCHGCRSSVYSHSVRALQAIESRPFMFRFHETVYEEFIGSQAPVADPIGGYLSGNQRYVFNGAGIGAPEELVLQTFLGGSITTSFRSRGPGFFFYYFFESVTRGRVLVVVDSSPPPCCATNS